MLGLSPVASRPLASAIESEKRALLADTGAYLLTGNAVALRLARVIVPAAGAYVLTGVVVDFQRTSSTDALGRIVLQGTTATQRTAMTTQITNFEMTAGDTKTLVVTVRDADDDPVTITGATIKWQCARSLGKTSDISKATGGSGISITDGPNGVFTVTLNASDTNSLSGKFRHEAEVTLSGTVSTVLVGVMKVNRALIEAT